ncbi:hypothetical protein JYU34_013324 [Plutella xylostella]|uniref:Uncharacterized protein n=1 Tax=Plutella xylostella TaxID=51655 RepID=A0ABQ7QAW8_PLUXY|nr:hypothetical protein JYU34_013324 [Plutella xylostella]
MSKEAGSVKAEAPKEPLDLNDVEMVFGTPPAPKDAGPDVHTVANEKTGKDSPR